MTRDEREAILRRLETIAHWMDDRFAIPGTRWRIGLDGLLGLFPAVGDTATFLVSLYILLQARRLNLPGKLQARMLGNVVLDYLAGSIPLVGDIVDVAWKANLRNIDLIRREAVARPSRPETD